MKGNADKCNDPMTLCEYKCRRNVSIVTLTQLLQNTPLEWMKCLYS